MTGCPPGPAFDIAQTSGFYAQMAGLLSGFAFSAIIFLLKPRKPGAQPDGVVLTLLVAFVGLIISTLTYSVLAGEKNAYGRAAAQELMDGLPFALAIMMLFHGVAQLVSRSSGIDPVVVRTSQILTTIITPTLAMSYLISGAIDTQHARIAATRELDKAFCGDLEPVSTVGMILLALLVVLLVAARWIHPPQTWHEWAAAKAATVPQIVLWVSVASALGVGVVTLQHPSFLLPVWTLILFLALAWTLFLALALMILWAARATMRAANGNYSEAVATQQD